MLRGMESKSLERIETLLRIIADELYIARTDRDSDNRLFIKGCVPEDWEKQGRHSMIREIDQMRDKSRK